MIEKSLDRSGARTRIQDRVAQLDFRRLALTIMTFGTLALAALLLWAMLQQTFEPTDDLIWFTKLRQQTYAELPFSAAWMLSSPFYRPVAEVLLKTLYTLFGMDRTPYRLIQFATIVLLIGIGYVVLRRLRVNREYVLLLTVFTIGSPFIFGSLVWISELPHVLVLICYATCLAAILSERPISGKLFQCGLAFAIAALSKENGLALLLFYLYFVRTIPIGSTLVFGGITVAYFGLRHALFGPSMGVSGNMESNGFLFDYMTSEQRQQLFSGSAAYGLYVYNVVAQLAALLFRATQWGVIFKRPNYQALVETASTVLIAIGIAKSIARERKVSAFISLSIVAVVGGTFFSFTYARDRHLALPAFAYAFLLTFAVAEIGNSLRVRVSANAATALVFCVWIGWSIQTYQQIKDLPRISREIAEKSYLPFQTSPNPHIDEDIWDTARQEALSLVNR
jgi:hypothetical protein